MSVTTQDAGGGTRRHSHLPDLGVVTKDRRAVAYEVELQSKRKERVRAVLAAYRKRFESAADELDGRVYVVDSPRVAKLVAGIAEELGLNGALTIRPLDDVIAEAQKKAT